MGAQDDELAEPILEDVQDEEDPLVILARQPVNQQPAARHEPALNGYVTRQQRQEVGVRRAAVVRSQQVAIFTFPMNSCCRLGMLTEARAVQQQLEERRLGLRDNIARQLAKRQIEDGNEQGILCETETPRWNYFEDSWKKRKWTCMATKKGSHTPSSTVYS